MSQHRHINPVGALLIQEFEGLRLTAYRCSAGTWTIGWGHTGPDVHEGLVIDHHRAEMLFLADLEQFEQGISRSLGGAPTTDNQFSAMVAFAFNVGLGAAKSSSVLRWHRMQLPARAAEAFGLWNHCNGKVLPGLTRRRRAEAKLYLTPDGET
jgi:lysozyme